MPERASIQGQMPAQVGSVFIEAQPMVPGTMKNVSKPVLGEAPAVFAGYVKDALALKRPGWQLTVAEKGRGAPGQDLVVTTQLLSVDGGSAALRFWIGLGTGGVESRVNVSIHDKMGLEVASTKLTMRTDCPVGACVESNDLVVERNLKDLATEVAEFVVDPAGYDKKKAAAAKH